MGEVTFQTSLTETNEVAIQFPELSNTGAGNHINKKVQTNLQYLKYRNEQTLSRLEHDAIVFEFYIVNTFLTRFALKLIERKSLTHPRALFIQWKFMNLELRTPSFKISSDIPIHFRYSCPITSPELFFQSIQQVKVEYVMLNMDNDHQLVVGRGKLDFNELLRYPHKKIYANTQINIVHASLSLPDKLFASLFYWFELKADQEILDSFFATRLYNKIQSDDSIFSINAADNELVYGLKDVVESAEPPKESNDKSEFFAEKKPSLTSLKSPKKTTTDVEEKPILIEDDGSIRQIKKTGISALDQGTSHLFGSEFVRELTSKPKLDMRKSTMKDSIPQRFTSKTTESSILDTLSISGSQNTKTNSEIVPTKSEIQRFDEAKDLVATRNRALSTRQSDISVELKERTEWLFEEANWKRTLQENAILNGKNPAEINWRQWRNETNGVEKPRKFTATGNKPKIFTIIVHSLTFDKSSPVMLNPKPDQFYIEYSFLQYNGELLETPLSVPKPDRTDIQPLVFEFSKEYSLDPETNKDDCKVLGDKILAKDKLRFLIISEPFRNSLEIIDCEEVGVVEIGYYDLVDLEEDVVEKDYPVRSMTLPTIDIGFLKLSFLGINVLRYTALQTLTPLGFKLPN